MSTAKKISRAQLTSMLEYAKEQNDAELITSLEMSILRCEQNDLFTGGFAKKRSYNPRQQQIVDYLDTLWAQTIATPEVAALVTELKTTEKSFTTHDKKTGAPTVKYITNIRVYFDTKTAPKSEQTATVAPIVEVAPPQALQANAPLQAQAIAPPVAIAQTEQAIDPTISLADAPSFNVAPAPIVPTIAQ